MMNAGRIILSEARRDPRSEFGFPGARVAAFSLVEMLVVVGVIAVLAALAFPFSRKVLGNAHSAQCASNLRQLYLTAANCAASDDTAFYGQYQGYNWDGRIRREMNMPEPQVGARPQGILACPASKWVVKVPVWASDYNNNCFVNTFPGVGALYAWCSEFRSFAAMPNASKVFFLADSKLVGNSAERGRDLAPGTIDGRHGGFANMLFYDGHVEALDLRDPRSDLNNPDASYRLMPWQPL